MIFEAIVAILVPISVLIVGLALLVFSSDRAVKHSISFASAMGASPLMIGLILVSIGARAARAILFIFLHLLSYLLLRA